MDEMDHPLSLPTPNESLLKLQDHTYTRNMTHPITLTRQRYILGDRFHDRADCSGHKKPTCIFHNMRLFPELVQYQSVTSEVINAKIKAVRLQSSSQQNTTHYFFYNRLMDHWHNRAIVTKQLLQLQKYARHGTFFTDLCLFVIYVAHWPKLLTKHVTNIYSVYIKATHFMYNLIPEQQTMTRNIISTSRCSPYKSD